MAQKYERGRHARKPRPPKQGERGRVCHCGTVLSVYNTEDTCHKHRERKRRPMTDKDVKL